MGVVTTFDDLMDRVHVAEGCWEWLGAKSHQGYGRPWFEGRRQFAHRIFYERHRGPIPDGAEIDHLCKNRACVNPAHLEPVSRAENIRRSNGVQVINSVKERCDYGHPFDASNTYLTPDGRRQCRVCLREAQRRYRNRKKVV